MKKALLFFIFLYFIPANSYCQTATIKVIGGFNKDGFEKFETIKFYINNTILSVASTISQKIKLQNGFDKCVAIIGNDTLKFITKFKKDTEYEIKQGCCCSAFILEPKIKPKRGTVTFKNKTKRNLGFIVAIANADTVKSNTRKTTFASESAMCMFKPCSILITETSYFADKYEYKNDKRDYEKLWKEQNKFIRTISHFHFLHGEKIELFYNDKTKKSEIKLLGYMTDNEYKRILNKN
jgi:hypothetical protein